jgi:hypothetical protein
LFVYSCLSITTQNEDLTESINGHQKYIRLWNVARTNLQNGKLQTDQGIQTIQLTKTWNNAGKHYDLYRDSTKHNWDTIDVRK